MCLVHVGTYIHTYIHHTHIYIYTYTYIYIYIYIHTYTYIYTYIHTYIYIYIYMFKSFENPPSTRRLVCMPTFSRRFYRVHLHHQDSPSVRCLGSLEHDAEQTQKERLLRRYRHSASESLRIYILPKWPSTEARLALSLPSLTGNNTEGLQSW